MTASLEFNDVSVHMRGKALLENITLKLAEGEFVALVGPNGAGKTTLLRSALNLVRCQGAALLNGKSVADYSGRERAALLGWLPQQALVGEAITALELCVSARYRFSESHAAARKAAMHALEQAGASDFANRIVTSLSGGEHQRVATAALLSQESPLLLLDEPANHLDPAQQIGLYQLFGKLWKAGQGILCITHDVNLLRHVGDTGIRVAGIGDGKLRFELAYDSPELPSQMTELFNVPFDVVPTDDGRLLIPGGRP